MTAAAETTSLYIHVPFCQKKCPYCDFFSVPVDPADIGSYADLLIRHLQLLAAHPDAKPLTAIFFGGGTPSLLPSADVARILNSAQQLLGFAGEVEISLEANPGTVDEKLAGYRGAGINRLSIGIQALCDQRLHRLGRIHSAADAEECIRSARAAGFDNLSCDLMFALPGQTLTDLQADLERLLTFAPEHLAIYGLTVEEGTPFHAWTEAGQLELPDEEVYVAEYRMLHEKLEAVGYRHYEISNFARPGFECRHNLRYWQRRENLAIGAGAHSFDCNGWGRRSAVPASLEAYADNLMAGRSPAEVIESFDRQGAMGETLYLGLRTAIGVDAEKFHDRFGTTVETAYPDAVRKCGAFLRKDEGFWRFNLEGWLLFDTLLVPFL